MTTTTFRVKDNTGWKSTIGFKTLKEAIKYTKVINTDKSWKGVTHFYIEVIRITRYPTSKRSTYEILIKDVIFYIRSKNEWRFNKNNKVVKF